jgi:hypothetical protein
MYAYTQRIDVILALAWVISRCGAVTRLSYRIHAVAATRLRRCFLQSRWSQRDERFFRGRDI